jgi:hypothetical protein
MQRPIVTAEEGRTMLVGSKRYSQLHRHAQHLLKKNFLYGASQLSNVAADYEKRGLMARAYTRHFCAWLEMRLRHTTYDGELVDCPYDLWSAPRQPPSQF